MSELEEAETVVREASDPVVTANDVADELGCSSRHALDLLRLLEKNGDVASKEVGARAVAWWHPSRIRPAATSEQPERSADPPETDDKPADTSPSPATAGGSGGLEDRMTAALDNLDVPGRSSQVEHARREAIKFAWRYLREHGTARSSEIANATFGAFFDERINYSTSSRYPGYGLWDNCVREQLKQLPGVEAPGRRGSNWHFDAQTA